MAREEQRRANGPRGMHIVAAGVHDPRIRGRIFQPGVLGDWQRIDITANRYGGRAGVGAGNSRDEPGARNTTDIRDSDVPQRALQSRLRRSLLPGQLRMPMQITPQLQQQRAIFLREQCFEAHARSSADRTVSASTRSTSTSTPIPGLSSGTRTMPSVIVHTGATTSCAQ